MQAISGNIGFDLCKMDSSENFYSPTETEDDVYLTTQNCQSQPRKRTDIFIQKKVKFCVSALGLLLLLSALMALCAVGILYHNKVVSFEILHEQYENATATLMMQENKAKEKERMYEALEAKYLELNISCSKKEGMYEVLEVKYQELDFVCNMNQSRRCEEGWKSLGLKCYYFSTEKLNWMQSRDYCVGKGGHLVIINSQTEQNFAFSQIGETHWIGLNDLEAEGKWMWVNNQPLKETDVKFWFAGDSNEPDNWEKEDPSGEDCAALGHEEGVLHKWFDASCHKQKLFICEEYTYTLLTCIFYVIF